MSTSRFSEPAKTEARGVALEPLQMESSRVCRGDGAELWIRPHSGKSILFVGDVLDSPEVPGVPAAIVQASTRSRR